MKCYNNCCTHYICTDLTIKKIIAKMYRKVFICGNISDLLSTLQAGRKSRSNTKTVLGTGGDDSPIAFLFISWWYQKQWQVIGIHNKSDMTYLTVLSLLWPRPCRGGVVINCPLLSVHLSVCGMPRHNSRMERPRKPKIGEWKPITRVSCEPI